MPNPLDFNNTQTAFSHKSDKELKRSYWLFRALNIRFLTQFGIAAAQFALRLHLPITFIIRATVFRHFCGGNTLEESTSTSEALTDYGIQTALDYAVEGQNKDAAFERTTEEAIRAIEFSKNNPSISFVTLKPTGLARFQLLEKVTAQAPLSAPEETAYKKVKKRLHRIAQAAEKANVKLFIDAEESWIQDAIDELVTGLMEKYNQRSPVVFNTIQLYRKDRLDFLKKSHQHAKRGGYYLAVKLVRGAYMEKERKWARKAGVPSPIHETKAGTDAAYKKALQYGIHHLDEIAFCAATHNEKSCKYLTELMEREGLEKTHPHIFFCQLYGMGDHITYNLADAGYNISKYVPYGPVKEVIPYLIRRAKENTSISGQMSRELRLLSEEIQRRKKQQ